MGKLLRVFLVSTVIAIVARGAGAVTLTMGNLSTAATGGDTVHVGAAVVDLNHPASATGSLTTVKLAWGGSCPVGPTHIKIVRRSGDSMTVVGDRAIGIPGGSLLKTIGLSPPLPVHQGDFIGIDTTGSCGGILLDSNPFAGTYLVVFHDLEGTIPFDPSDIQSGALALAATGTVSEFRAGIIPAVGSGAGLNGARFVTSLQMIAPGPGGAVNGRLVFHPAGAEGRVDDPSLSISIAAGHSLAFADIVTAMGQTGFGSIDVVLTPSSAIPVTIARVFNDQEEAGSSGVGEEMLLDSESSSSGGRIVPAGFTGYLSAPVDASKTRFNLGIRTLDAGAFVTFTLKDSSGGVKGTYASSFASNYFNQFHAEDLFGTALGSNDIVEVTVSTGSAIVFGSTTDNVTNDPSYQFVHPVFGVL